jgi:hypothetical protein
VLDRPSKLLKESESMEIGECSSPIEELEKIKTRKISNTVVWVKNITYQNKFYKPSERNEISFLKRL